MAFTLGMSMGSSTSTQASSMKRKEPKPNSSNGSINTSAPSSSSSSSGGPPQWLMMNGMVATSASLTSLLGERLPMSLKCVIYQLLSLQSWVRLSRINKQWMMASYRREAILPNAVYIIRDPPPSSASLSSASTTTLSKSSWSRVSVPRSVNAATTNTSNTNSGSDSGNDNNVVMSHHEPQILSLFRRLRNNRAKSIVLPSSISICLCPVAGAFPSKPSIYTKNVLLDHVVSMRDTLRDLTLDIIILQPNRLKRHLAQLPFLTSLTINCKSNLNNNNTIGNDNLCLPWLSLISLQSLTTFQSNYRCRVPFRVDDIKQLPSSLTSLEIPACNINGTMLKSLLNRLPLLSSLAVQVSIEPADASQWLSVLTSTTLTRLSRVLDQLPVEFLKTAQLIPSPELSLSPLQHITIYDVSNPSGYMEALALIIPNITTMNLTIDYATADELISITQFKSLKQLTLIANTTAGGLLSEVLPQLSYMLHSLTLTIPSTMKFRDLDSLTGLTTLSLSLTGYFNRSLVNVPQYHDQFPRHPHLYYISLLDNDTQPLEWSSFIETIQPVTPYHRLHLYDNEIIVDKWLTALGRSPSSIVFMDASNDAIARLEPRGIRCVPPSLSFID
jgi:hypothetical protein